MIQANLLKTFRPRGVILFFLRTTRGERKSELIQIDCKEEERLGRREEKKDDRGRVYCILKLPCQWNRNSRLVRHFSTTNNLSLLQVKASDIVSNVNQGGVKSGRSPDQRSHRSFLFFFFFLGFRPRSSRLHHSPLTRALELLWLKRKIRDSSQSSRSPFGSLRNAQVREDCVMELKYICKRGYKWNHIMFTLYCVTNEDITEILPETRMRLQTRTASSWFHDVWRK